MMSFGTTRRRLSMEERLARAREFYSMTRPTLILNLTVIAPSSMGDKALDLLEEQCSHAVFEAFSQLGLGEEVVV